MTALFVQERPDGIIGPFCKRHAAALQLAYTDPIRPLTDADVVAYGDVMSACKWCAHPERWESLVSAITGDGRCATCKWWKSIRESGRGWCVRIETDVTANFPPKEPAIILYEIGDAVYLDTSSDFGCTLHERKDP